MTQLRMAMHRSTSLPISSDSITLLEGEDRLHDPCVLSLSKDRQHM